MHPDENLKQNLAISGYGQIYGSKDGHFGNHYLCVYGIYRPPVLHAGDR